MVTITGAQPESTGTIDHRKSITDRRPEKLVLNNFTNVWDTSILSLPVIVDREDEVLWNDVPAQGIVIAYLEQGGIRRTMLSNWKYVEEIATITVEVKTLTSNAVLLRMLNECERIVEKQTRQVSPFHTARIISRVQATKSTYQAWFGVLRIELRRVGVRTALT